MKNQLFTIEQYERYLLFKGKHKQAEAVVNFLWKLKQPLWTSYTLEERSAIDKALNSAESKMIAYAKKRDNAHKYTNIQKHNSTQSA